MNTGIQHGCVVAALYKFTRFQDPECLAAQLRPVCIANDVRGTLLIAPEGINGTIAGTRWGINAVLDRIRALPGCGDIAWKESIAPVMPFKRMKVRLKREIVSMGIAGLDPAGSAGTYVDPKDWNALISEPDVVVIDTRNAYEVAIGSFRDAIDPRTSSFGAFPGWAETNLDPANGQRIAMFCTGGIRCEKATAYLKARGFEDVYHLRGGILKYLEEVPPEDSLWQGQCFVFDERVSVGHGLEPGPYQFCSICRMPWQTGSERGGYSDEICPQCTLAADSRRKQAASERRRQIEIAERRGLRHLGQGQTDAQAKSEN